jgi:hypothetical protein
MLHDEPVLRRKRSRSSNERARPLAARVGGKQLYDVGSVSKTRPARRKIWRLAPFRFGAPETLWNPTKPPKLSLEILGQNWPRFGKACQNSLEAALIPPPRPPGALPPGRRYRRGRCPRRFRLVDTTRKMGRSPPRSASAATFSRTACAALGQAREDLPNLPPQDVLDAARKSMAPLGTTTLRRRCCSSTSRRFKWDSAEARFCGCSGYRFRSLFFLPSSGITDSVREGRWRLPSPSWCVVSWRRVRIGRAI